MVTLYCTTSPAIIFCIASSAEIAAGNLYSPAFSDSPSGRNRARTAEDAGVADHAGSSSWPAMPLTGCRESMTTVVSAVDGPGALKPCSSNRRPRRRR